MSPSPPNEKPSRSLGPVLFLVGLLTLILARDIPQSTLGNNEDPGPRAFPNALAILLILGGLYEQARTLRLRRPAPAPSAARNKSSVWKNLSRVENRNALILVGALALYLVAIPWVGFPLATLLFSAGMMLQLGAHWRLAAPFSLGLVAVIYLLFTVLFRVQLPVGVLGLSW